MTSNRIPKWEIPNHFGTKLTLEEEDRVLSEIVKALRLLETDGKRMKLVAGAYAEAIDLEARRRGGFYGDMRKVKKDKSPNCLICNTEGSLRLFPI